MDSTVMVQNTSALHVACGYNNFEIFQILIKDTDPASLNKEDSLGRTLISEAIQKDNDKMIKILVEKGVNLLKEDKFGYIPFNTLKFQFAQSLTPLLRDATIKQIRERIKELKAKGASIDSKDEFENTPLILAITVKDYLFVREILEMGASANVCGKKGNSPLHYVVRGGDLMMAQVIVEKGGKELIVTKNDEGEIPIHTCINYQRQDLIIYFATVYPESADFLNDSKQTPLYRAANHGSDFNNVAFALIDHGANVNFQHDVTYNTPLHLAVLKGNKNLIEKLCKKGADPHFKNKEGKSPFQIAEGMKDQDIMTMFLRVKEAK